jgi:hypothetical protein
MLQDAQLFYSRRIGIQDGNQIPILGGARLMGTSGNTTIGAMSIQTANKGDVAAANYSTFRIKQNILERSFIGMIVTSKIDEGVQNLNYGIDFNYKYTKLFGDKNLIFQSSFAESIFDKSTNKNNSAYNVILTMPNDEFYYSAAYQRIDENFRPLTGFVNRNNYDYFQTEYVYKPRIESSGIIQQLTFKPFEFKTIINDTTGEYEFFEYSFRPMGIITESGDAFYFNYSRTLERLYDDFQFLNNIIIPAQDYSVNNYTAEVNTFNGRQIYLYAGYRWGGFFNGNLNRYSTSVNLNLGRHLNISADYTRNNIFFEQTDVKTDEFGGRVEYAFNPDLNTSLFGQWNNDRNEMLFNFRFHWIPNPGSNFFLVINQLVDTNNQIVLKDTAILTKLVWRFGV